MGTAGPFSRNQLVMAAGAAIVVSVALATSWGQAATSPFRAFVRPFAGWFSQRARNWHMRNASIITLRADRDQLQEEVTRLYAALRDAAVCREENKALKSLVQYVPGPGFATVSARVLSYANTEKTQMLIDQGTEDGVVRGAAAVSGEGIMVGRVIATDREFSIVALLSDPAVAIPARVAESEHEGIVRRRSDGSIILDLIPVTAIVAEDAPVITSGIDERIPANLMIGRVARSEKLAHEPFQHIEVTPVRLTLPAFLYITMPNHVSK